LNEKYRVAPAHEARAWWERQYDLVPPIETREICIIGGAIIPLWQKLKTKEDARLRVVRVSTEDGQRIVGVKIPRSQVRQVLRALGLDGPKSDPLQIFHELMQGGGPFTLVSGLSLKASTLQRERTIELECHDPDRFQELRILGLINEQIRYKQHFFVPADEEAGVPILTELLARYPIVSGGSSESEDSLQESLALEVPATEAAVIDLDHWVIPPTEIADVPVSTRFDLPVHQSASTDNAGPSWQELLRYREGLPARGRRRPQLSVKQQGALFALGE
jgi:hypothetical protein